MSDTNETAGETASNEAKYVSIEEAADADLTAYLEKAKAERRDSTEEDDEEDFDEEDAGEPEPESEELSDETEVAKAPPEKLNGKDKDAEIAVLKAQKEEISKKRDEERRQRETYIQRLKHQLGEARKAKGETEKELTAKYRELLDVDPAEAIEARLALGQVKQELSDIDAYEQQVDQVHENQSIFEANVDPSEVSIDEIVASFEREGLPPAVVQSIKEKPFAAMRAETLVQAHHKVKAQRALFAVVEYARSLEAKLQGQQTSSKPRTLEDSLRKVSRTAQQIPQITGARGGGSASTDLRDIDVDNMSDAELKELAKKLRSSR